jgi:hypothetical protein
LASGLAGDGLGIGSIIVEHNRQLSQALDHRWMFGGRGPVSGRRQQLLQLAFDAVEVFSSAGGDLVPPQGGIQPLEQGMEVFAEGLTFLDDCWANHNCRLRNI